VAAVVTEQIKAEILEIFPNADFDKYKYGVPKKHPLYEKFRSFARRKDKAIYEKTPERIARRRDSQKASYARNPESFLARNRKYLTKPDVAEKRRKYLQDKYYYGGQREKDLLRLKGKVASKGYGGYFKNPDNALLKDMVRMAEQNPDSGLEIIRKGPRNLIVGVKEGDTIYHAVASKRKPVAYAPKNSVPITEHPDFKTRFEFTKLQKNFLNTKLKGSDLTYGKALDILQSSKAGSALQNKNPAEFEHIKGAATDYKEGQIALRTANRDKQKILAALENNNITLDDADKQLKKIGVRAFVDNKYIGAPEIDPNKQFDDLKKYVDRNVNKVNDLKNLYDSQPKGAPLRKYFEKEIAKCADGCFVKVANKNPEKILKNAFDDPKLISLLEGGQVTTADKLPRPDDAKLADTFKETNLRWNNDVGAFETTNGDIASQSDIKKYAADNPMEVKVGEEPVKAATNKSVLANVGKAMARVGAPLPVAAIDAYFIGQQVKEGKGTAEIASNPLNWLGLATMEPLAKASGIAEGGGLNKALRLGLNPATIRGITRFAGLPGLAVSTAMTAYDQYQKYKDGEGFIFNLLNQKGTE
jgi:hypothetical protein